MADQPDMGYFGGGSSGHQLAIPTTTTFELTGHTVTRSLGTCFGLVVRSMGMGKGIAAGFRSLVGGEVKQYTELLEDSRRHAMDRMVDNATLLGANAGRRGALRLVGDRPEPHRGRGVRHGRGGRGLGPLMFGFVVLGALAVILVVSLFVKRHGESDRAHPDWSATDERFRDPSTGRLMRVWLDSTGTRHYVPE